MATALRPIGHDARLSVVDHLDELRKRLVVCVLALVVAFGFAFWQNGRILDVVNKPYVDATSAHANQPSREDRIGGIAASLIHARPGLAEAAGAAHGLAGSSSQSPLDRARFGKLAAGLDSSLKALPTKIPNQVPVTLGIAEPFTATVVVAAYAALLLALPIILYQLYAFILPAFSPKERRIAFPVMLMVPFLFVAGVLFGYFLVLPAAVGFLQTFNHQQFDVLVQAQAYYKFDVILLLAMGVIFQVPVGMLALNRVGIVSSAFLRKNWRYITVGTVIVAALGPGVDPVTTLLEWAPLMFLYALSIVLVMLAERRAGKRAAAERSDEDSPLLDLVEERD